MFCPFTYEEAGLAARLTTSAHCWTETGPTAMDGLKRIHAIIESVTVH